ncbi:Glycerol-3-phosphate acyltransferase [Mesoplasma lactucae ATCC 49193]|uniref:Glycerol-3-phosphate acyltransferase n=1 Tax=Mesoplasma lactucae ATCC 49193 TaxID=81460 RepID=A0A291IRM2_9MOLU|nr:glycerol-3-phosphate 1-O-acyltransferase PlsY [Mesoplasma lactucae]ATG97400.1 acyl-phosphate glycerol 3-phosphate acyltransferase [Mesoplasma lactucae ATCC 49193]ATZ20147.1 glycerol-3-phosphate acyltransferase PlsY [Mesoplasma lactucae ATCC 49193]MCL8216895.1 Glycerol-3-phosphate acyltransferase [Mesoplasma lactucae ATCC 49193]
MHYLGIILASIIAYFIGSISWSTIIVKRVAGVDIRTVGSGNPGATNTVRVLGKGWGFLAALLDGLKTVVAGLVAVLFSLIPSYLFSETSYFIPALFALIGHCWPIYYKFKGGKAVSCFLGLIFISNIWYLLIFLVVWFIAAAISRRVSVASIAGAVTVGIVIWLPWLNGLNSFIWEWNGYQTWVDQAWNNAWTRFAWMNYLHMPIYENITSGHSGVKYGFASGMLEIQIVNIVGGLILLVRHKPNILRLWHHQEPETFPRLTPEERQKLWYLRLLKRPNHDERKELRRLKKIEKLEKKAARMNERYEAKSGKVNQKIEKLDNSKNNEKSKTETEVKITVKEEPSKKNRK